MTQEHHFKTKYNQTSMFPKKLLCLTLPPTAVAPPSAVHAAVVVFDSENARDNNVHEQQAELQRYASFAILAGFCQFGVGDRSDAWDRVAMPSLG